VTDGAAPGCVAAGEVEAVLVGADRITANGDVVGTAGAYPLALTCHASDIPFIVCAPTNVIDLAVADGASATIEEGRPTPVLRAGGTRIAPEGTQVRNPVQDLVPASLVTAIVTEEGVARAPFGDALAAAVAAASGRRTRSKGYAALLAQRAAAVPVPAPVDVAALRNPPRTLGS
jgi:methylthioribose-1-phosphate isomerase